MGGGLTGSFVHADRRLREKQPEDEGHTEEEERRTSEIQPLGTNPTSKRGRSGPDVLM